MFEYGEAHGALLVFPEHRYYGQTAPFGRNSWNKTSIFYLTVELALLDFRENIRFIRAQYNVPDEAPLITFGGSYPGDLAALLRVNFPNDVDAALASSAPLALNPSQYGFFRVVTESFAMQNTTCPDIVRAAFVEMQTLANSPTTWLDLQLRLHLCDQQHDLHLLYLWVLNAFSTLGMENYPYATSDFGAYPMKQACADAVDTMNQYGDPLQVRQLLCDCVVRECVLLPCQALASALAVVYNETAKGCFDINAADFINCADVTGCGTGTDALSWDFQARLCARVCLCDR
jgi:dipeptidyl-peptidase-2